MKILKYILLLVVLILLGFAVYVATQNGEYEVKRSRFIKAEKNVVFSYVNDYRNWENFGSWKDEDPEIVFTYADTTIGKGASYSWKGKEGSGKTETIFEKENDSIAQKVTFSGNEAQAYLTFKDTVGGTNVTWGSKGKLDFMGKTYAIFKGGADKMIGSIYEKTLEKLDKVLTFEMNTYDIKVNGVAQKSGGFYLQQKVVCKIPEIQKNISLILPRMIRFFKENNIDLTGSPFVLYNFYDIPNNKASFSVCLPMREEIYTSDESDYTSGKLDPFEAVKTTLKGDYSHGKEAWDKTFEYIKQNNLIENTAGNYMEVYVTSASEVKSPSKWVTEIYIPIGKSAPVTTEVPTTVPAAKPVVPEAKIIE